jgi:hypothetical protein
MTENLIKHSFENSEHKAKSMQKIKQEFNSERFKVDLG